MTQLYAVVGDSASISTSEYYLMSDSTTPTAQTTKTRGLAFVDWSNLTATETYGFSIWEKVNGSTMRKVFYREFVGVQELAHYTPPEHWLNEGYEFSVIKVAGTTKTIGWATKLDVGDVNLVAWNGTAPNALISGRVDGTVGAMQSGVLTATAVADAAIDRAAFAQDAKDMFGEIRRNTAQAGAAGAITLDASASAVDDFYKNALVLIVGGTGAGEFNQVASYAGSTKVATMMGNWATTPDSTSVFVIFPAPGGISGTVNANVVSWLGTAAAAPTVAGIPKVEDATLQSRLTALRAGYLDNISAGAVALQSSSVAIAALIAALPSATTVRDALLSYSYAPGRTFVGYIRRAGASLERATGLRGTTVAYLTQAGVTIWSIAQSVLNGTRGSIDLGSTEDPP